MTANLDPNLLWQEALTQFDAQCHSAAEACCYRLIASASGSPMAYALLARIFHIKGLASTATFYAFEACRRIAGAPCKDILWVSAALLEVGERGPAHEVLSFIDPLLPAHREGLQDLARQYSALGDQPRARYCNQLIESGAIQFKPLRVPVHT